MREPILIVDDTPANLRLLEVLLQAHGYEVRTATDAESTLRALETFRPRMILLDIGLPDMDGLALVRTLRQRPDTRATAIVAVTAHAMRGDEAEALAAGFDGFVTKPIEVRTLPDTLARFLASRTGG